MTRRNYLLLACILFLLPGTMGVTLAEEISEEDYRFGMRPAPQFVLALVPADAEIVHAHYLMGCSGGRGSLYATEERLITDNLGDPYSLHVTYSYEVETYSVKDRFQGLIDSDRKKFEKKDEKWRKHLEDAPNKYEHTQSISGLNGVGYIESRESKTYVAKEDRHAVRITSYSGQYYALSDNVVIKVSIANATSAGEVTSFFANAEAISTEFAALMTQCD